MQALKKWFIGICILLSVVLFCGFVATTIPGPNVNADGNKDGNSSIVDEIPDSGNDDAGDSSGTQTPDSGNDNTGDSSGTETPGSGNDDAGDGSGTETPDNMITFTIDGMTYQAESGMTWGDWVESEYNTGEYKVFYPLDFPEDLVVNSAGYYVNHYEEGYAFTSMPIIDGLNCTTATIIEFSISGFNYYAEEGMTWYAWCASDYNTDGYTCASEAGRVENSNGTKYVVDDVATAYGSEVIKDGLACILLTVNPSGGTN